ncbi:MAG: hypothetical protein H6736_20940 [Alphaproteobacteria bacterium]|nr:hypothetical protein [Alphaproteobacteria bacterium]
MAERDPHAFFDADGTRRLREGRTAYLRARLQTFGISLVGVLLLALTAPGWIPTLLGPRGAQEAITGVLFWGTGLSFALHFLASQKVFRLHLTERMKIGIDLVTPASFWVATPSEGGVSLERHVARQPPTVDMAATLDERSVLGTLAPPPPAFLSWDQARPMRIDGDALVLGDTRMPFGPQERARVEALLVDLRRASGEDIPEDPEGDFVADHGALEATLFAGVDPLGTERREQARSRRGALAIGLTLLGIVAMPVAAWLTQAWSRDYSGAAAFAGALIALVCALFPTLWAWSPLVVVENGALRLRATRSWWRLRADRAGIAIDRLFGDGRPPVERLRDPRPSRSLLEVDLPAVPELIPWEDVGPIRCEGSTLFLGEVALPFAPEERESLVAHARELEAIRQRTVASQVHRPEDQALLAGIRRQTS